MKTLPEAGNPAGHGELGVAFQKGTHEELARQLEQTLAEMAADGTMAEILTAYGINGTVRMEESKANETGNLS